MCPISIFTCIGIGFAIDRFPPKAILFLGLLAMVLAPISAGVMKPETSFWASVFPVAIIGVAAISVVYNVVSILMLAAVPPYVSSALHALPAESMLTRLSHADPPSPSQVASATPAFKS